MRPLFAPAGVFFLALTAVVAVAPRPARAGWTLDGEPISTEPSCLYPDVAPDGTGGSFIAWQDGRNASWDIFIQRLDASGNPEWGANGVALCTAANNQYKPQILPDGTGGAIVVWYDYRSGSNYDIYAQRVDASGTPLWTGDGVAVCTAAGDQISPRIITDGSGGAIMAWQDLRNGGDYDIYAQRLDATGTRKWTADGVAVCTSAFDQVQVEIAPDGAGGMLAAWQDLRNGTTEHIYAQLVNAAGATQWIDNGVALVLAANYQLSPVIVSDGAGGAIVAWEDFRNGTDYNVYAQRISSGGATKWPPNGNPVCTASNDQITLDMVEDGAGGAVLTWRDLRSGADYDIYAQRLDGEGHIQWTIDGLGVCTLSNDQINPNIVRGTANFIIAWADYRNGIEYNVYAQAIAPSGLPQWTADGTPLCSEPSTQLSVVASSDGAGGAVVVWEDFRSGDSYVYAQRVDDTYGYWGHPEPIVDAVADIPNDQGGKVAVDWTASGRDLPNPQTISRYSIWRAVNAIPAAGAGGSTVLTDLGQLRAGTTGPVYASLTTVPGYYWELVGTQDAHGWPGYSFSADTRADSVSGGTGTEVFMVAAHDQVDDYVAFASNAMSGHSVDNLAPAAPLMLTAQRVGSDVHLAWNPVAAVDLRDYAIYRALAPGVTPEPVNFLSDSPDTDWVDTGVPTSALYYIVTASDVHENQSDPSNEVVVGTETGVGGTLPVTALRVLANRPNPFAASTLFRVGLPAAAPVRVEVFDVSGRRVRVQDLAGNAGWQDLVFDGRDDAGRLLPGGIYLYRVAAGGKTITHKILIAR